jgi:transcription antitermination factor NusG
MAMNSANMTLGAASKVREAASPPEIASAMQNLGQPTALASESDVARWYVAYTSANHEKRVAAQLDTREVEHFLPLYESVRKWKDRRVRLELPLFPGYIFVHMALRDSLKVQQVPGVARLVGSDGRPAELPEEEIEALRASLESGARADPHPYMKVGRRVRVKAGPMTGVEGILLQRKGKLRVVISIELIQRSVAVEIEEADLEPVR